MDDDNNTCSICLEPLLAPASDDDAASNAFGTVTPCGHCFHQKCFEGWKKTVHRNHGSTRVKCPNCNKRSDGFVKIYLSAPAVSDSLGVNDDEVDALLHDSDDDDEEVGVLDNPRLVAEHYRRAPVAAAAARFIDVNDANDDDLFQEVVCIDIDDSDAEGQHRQPRNNRNRNRTVAAVAPFVRLADAASRPNPPSDKHRKIKNLAIKYKKRCDHLKRQNQEQAKAKKKLQLEHDTWRCRLHRVEEELESAKAKAHNTDIMLHSLQIRANTGEAAAARARSQVQVEKAKVASLENLLRCHQQKHDAEIKKMHEKSKRALDDVVELHPKLSMENAKLKRRIQKLEADVRLYQPQAAPPKRAPPTAAALTGIFDDDSSVEVPTSRKRKAKNAPKVPPNKPTRSTRMAALVATAQRVAPDMVVNGQYGAQATRMVSSTKKRRWSSGVDALNGAPDFSRVMGRMKSKRSSRRGHVRRV